MRRAEPDAAEPPMSRGDQPAETPDSSVHPARFVAKPGFTKRFCAAAEPEPKAKTRSQAGRDDVVRHEIAHALEPERRQLREDLALVGDPRAQHVVERRDAIGRDEEQVLADFVDVADLAAAVEFQIGKGRFDKGGG